VIVVDDGSTDGTWDYMEKLQLNLRLKAVQQTHQSRAQTQNTGIALAEGDVIISCDADMLLSPFSIEELVKRHQVLDCVMLIGFRGDVQASDPRIQPAALAANLPGILPPFAQDVRLQYGTWGWPESMCRDTDHLKRLGGGKHIIMCDGARWDLPGMVYGALFSLRRADLVTMDGYDERFYGWGCEDTLVGVRAIAMGLSILPIYSAAGLHVAHGDRSPRKWQEFSSNYRVFRAILSSSFAPDGNRWLSNAKSRIQRHLERAPSSVRRPDERSRLYETFDAAWADPDHRGKYLFSLGHYAEAAAAFAEVRGTPDQEAWALFDRGKALRLAGHPDGAALVLKESVARLPTRAWPLIELALALAAQGEFARARDDLDQAWKLDPPNPAISFLLNRPLAKHIERAAQYVRQGNHDLAVRDYEAALILDPHNTTAQVERALALVALGNPQAARQELDRVSQWANDIQDSTTRVELARLHLALGDRATAKLSLEQARRQNRRSPDIAARLAEVHAVAAQAHPLPLARSIVERSQAIPGWFGADEAELLVALTLRAMAQCRNGDPPILVEIGSYCGRATVTMGLSAQSLGRTDARVIAVDESLLGPGPEGRPPREVLRSQLEAHGLTDLVICAPEDDPSPWQRTSRLVLVDGRHDYAGVRDDVERYVPRLAPGGLLVFHDYADYFPGVQRCVDELLAEPAFDFVAQAGSLIALALKPSPPDHGETILAHDERAA
jgi:tetratricopeptide (TPR) repeat protein